LILKAVLLILSSYFKDYGAFQVEVDLNRITQDEADALQAAEIKIERPNPLRQQIRGLGGIAQVKSSRL